MEEPKGPTCPCGKSLTPRPSGSPKKYCGDDCKKSAANRRHYQKNRDRLAAKARKRKRHLAYLKRKANAVPVEPSPRRDFVRIRQGYDTMTNWAGAKKQCRGCDREFAPANLEQLYHDEACKRRAQNRKAYERKKRGDS